MKYPQYTWRQTPKDIEIRILLPKGTLSKQLTVKLLPKHIFVQMESYPPIVDHELL